ncbi:MAG: caspase family protein [Rhizobiaceae bacterium]
MKIRQFLHILTLAVCFLSFTSAAIAAMNPGEGNAWLTVSSQSTPQKAVALARKYSVNFQSVVVFSSTSGWFGVSLGWAERSRGELYKQQLIRHGLIPDDSYFTSGNRFIEAIWSSSGVTGRSVSRLVRRARLGLPGGNVVQPQRPIVVNSGGSAYVSGLRNTPDSFLSLRTGPRASAREILRMAVNTRLTIVSQNGGWYLVRLNNGQQGWAYGKYISRGSSTIKPANTQPAPIIVDRSMDGQLAKVAGLSRSSGGFLSLRREPSANGLELARLQPETRMTIRGKSGDWYKVNVRKDIGGWVFGRYVALVDVPTIGPEIARTEVPVIGPEKSDAVEADKTNDVKVASKPPEAADSQSSDGAVVNVSSGGKRVALVLGNSAYQHTLALPNPKNDAARMSEKLKGLGFDVITGIDGTWAEMRNSIREFVRILPDSDAALFFYAGHAMQIKGKNYLIPIDAKLEDKTSLDFETIELASILSFFSDPERVSIALLDACRDNPLSRKFARSFGATRSAFIGEGLSAPTTVRGNVLIGFSTAPGEVALDGDGDNSPFTTALLKHIGTPDMEIELMLKRVKADVYKDTDQQQEPWNNSGLRTEFYFNKTVKASKE